MKLSLSVRVAESRKNKRDVDTELPDLSSIAKNAGYEALCMRASQVGVQSSKERILWARKVLDDHGLALSMVTGDFAVPENSAEGPGCLRNISPHLDLAEVLDCDLIRVCMKEEADIPFAQEAADEAGERNIRLAHQSHTCSLFETVEGSLDILRKVGRPNFGLIYEPANLAVCGQEYGLDTLRTFQPYLFNVYFQNHAPDPNGTVLSETWIQGRVRSTSRPLEASGGIDFERAFEGLKAIGYDGYVTVHQAFGGDLPPQEAAIRSATFLRELI